MKEYYISGSFKKAPIINEISQTLYLNNFFRTYDWTKNKRASNLKELRKRANKEYEGLAKCDFMIFIFPGGKGSNIEFGIAKVLNKKIYILDSTNEVNLPEKTSTFYHMDNIIKFSGNINDFVNVILKNEK